MNPGDCPPCKIIIDGGRLAAAAIWFASGVSDPDAPSFLGDAARYLAAVIKADAEATAMGVRSGRIRAGADEAHAWSELNCHRAAMIEDTILNQDYDKLTAELLYRWATEDRLMATKLAGGEYSGAWIVNGVEGISPK